LYAQLSQTPTSHLNDVRYNFTTTSRNAKLRLSAWERKHVKNHKGSPARRAGTLEAAEPEWWKPGCHPVPGGNVVVREGEWGSIIAFTLRCVACLLDESVCL
jgi:1-phosphatidylinositol-3-phosphate 5-kinase